MDQEINNGSLGKKLIVPLVAVALFAVLVFGATYAYFSATISTNVNANLSANIPAATTGITTTANTCSFVVDPAVMVQSANSTSAKNETSCYLKVEIDGAANVMCSYDLVLTETSATGYEPSSTTINEFTAKITPTTNATKNTVVGSMYSVTTETNMDQLVKKADGPATLKSGVTITVETTGQKIHQTYTVDQKWYNINAEQNNRAGKVYTYELSAQNVKC